MFLPALAYSHHQQILNSQLAIHVLRRWHTNHEIKKLCKSNLNVKSVQKGQLLCMCQNIFMNICQQRRPFKNSDKRTQAENKVNSKAITRGRAVSRQLHAQL